MGRGTGRGACSYEFGCSSLVVTGSLLIHDDDEEDGEECVRRDDELFGGRWGGKSIKHDAYA